LVASSVVFVLEDLSQLEAEKNMPVWLIKAMIAGLFAVFCAATLAIGYGISRWTQARRLKKNKR
jgi:hypothetical protein